MKYCTCFSSDFDSMSEDQLHELIYERICPLWKVPYDQQLQDKQSAYQTLIDELLTELKELYEKSDQDVGKEQNDLNGKWLKECSTIALDPIRYDEQNTGYRNKCEFSVGLDKVIGFRLNAYKDGSLKVIAPGSDCPIMNEITLKMGQSFESYIKSHSNLEPVNGFTQEGQWKALTVRIGSNGCMLIIQANLNGLSDDAIETEKNALKQFFSQQPEVVSLYLNSSLLYGEKHIEQQMDANRLHFQISPVSFFQINVKAAEKCYQSIGELLALDQNAFLLDVCCGTGTIGLFLAHRVHKVLGVELNKDAVRDAHINAKNNGITNAEFVAGSAETQIGTLIMKAQQIAKEENIENLQIVAVLDPPRAGLSKYRRDQKLYRF
jgi:tRNA (uracil-5-)-methyltransferase